MIQKQLKTYFVQQKLNELKGTSRQSNKLWSQVENDRGQVFTLPDL